MAQPQSITDAMGTPTQQPYSQNFYFGQQPNQQKKDTQTNNSQNTDAQWWKYLIAGLAPMFGMGNNSMIASLLGTNQNNSQYNNQHYPQESYQGMYPYSQGTYGSFNPGAGGV